MDLELVSLEGERKLDLPAGRTLVVGRSAACDLPVPDPTISRRHAELRARGGRLAVKDLGSTNSTWVDARRVAAGDEVEAAPGATVVFGKVAFRLRPAAPPAALADVPEGTIIRRLPVSTDALRAASDRAPDADTGAEILAAFGRSALEHQGKKLALLLEIAKELAAQPEVDALLEKVVDITFQVMAVDRVAVLGLDPASGDLVPRISRNRLSAGSGDRYVPRSIARRAVDERVAVLTHNAAADARFNAQSILLHRVESAMCAPLVGGEGRVLGLIYVDSLTATHSFADEDLEFLVAFSGMAALALENSQLVERARREAVRLSNFQRYFAPELARQIAEHEGEVRLGGTKREVVILFSDIRGFTRLSEGMSPDDIAILLNEYFTEMVGIVFDGGGVLDKFIGDAVMALWGAPIAHPDAADRAVRAALEMQSALAELNRAWEEQGRPALGVGIGIDSGEVFAGNIGSDQRLEYTVLGDAVNTAARLCSQADAGEILLSAPVYRALAEPLEVEEVPPLTLKGKAEPVPVFRLQAP